MNDLKFTKNQIQNFIDTINENSNIILNLQENFIFDDIDMFKKGGKNKIHIKKQNRGKFTEYCGGTVTNECIRKGKNSSDPKIRKRATFAANVRKWNK